MPHRFAPAAVVLVGIVAATALGVRRDGDRAPTAASLAPGAPAPAPAPAPAAAPPPAEVLPGIDVLLRDSLHLVRGRRVGLITNHTAISRAGRSTIEVLRTAPGVRLVALFAPEHGITGTVGSGEWIRDGNDGSGVRVHSIYGRTERPTREMLRDLDVLVFDMQDVGARPYTYVWTMAMAMEAAAAARLPFVVLDRPNPITGRVEGPLMAMEMRELGLPITGYFPVPLRHGMTPGEIARYVNGQFAVGAELTVVPVDGWRRGTWFDETGLRWVRPSPNIRDVTGALSFSGLVMLEATNLSVGRGTPAPFTVVGAPYLDAPELLRRMRAHRFPGVVFDTTSFTPRGTEWMQFRNQHVRAVRLRVTDREAYRPVLTALAFLVEIQRMNPRQLGMGTMLQMLGSRWAPRAVRAGMDPREIERRWEEENLAWRRTTEPYRLYPE